MSDSPRPRDLALLILASGDLRPRQRARDQQADADGLDLKRRVLDQVAAIDPEPGELEIVLARVVETIGPPSGPTRAVAAEFLEEWAGANAAPDLVGHLIDEATRESAG